MFPSNPSAAFTNVTTHSLTTLRTRSGEDLAQIFFVLASSSQQIDSVSILSLVVIIKHGPQSPLLANAPATPVAQSPIQNNPTGPIPQFLLSPTQNGGQATISGVPLFLLNYNGS